MREFKRQIDKYKRRKIVKISEFKNDTINMIK